MQAHKDAYVQARAGDVIHIPAKGFTLLTLTYPAMHRGESPCASKQHSLDVSNAVFNVLALYKEMLSLCLHLLNLKDTHTSLFDAEKMYANNFHNVFFKASETTKWRQTIKYTS